MAKFCKWKANTVLHNNGESIPPVVPGGSQIIANHTIVADYNKIPAEYMTAVKKMWLSYAGESHSLAIRTGLLNLETAYPSYAVSVIESGNPEVYTDTNLRANRATWGDHDNATGWIHTYGEEDWYTNVASIAQTKTGLLYCKNTGPALDALGFGWCWDACWHNDIGGTIDPVYGCHWAGSSVGGPEGDLRWGLDSGDTVLTGNSVCMDTYLAATQSYIDYCTANSISTKVFFTTGTVDNYVYEIGYQCYLKWEHIRSYVLADPTRILFDYADILCYDDNGSETTWEWNGHTYPIITPTNFGDQSVGHIGAPGALRLAKAIWWMLARMAGWDGN